MFSRPAALFFCVLVVLTGAGAFLLAQPWATLTDPRDWQFFWARHYWQSTFDSISAVVGCGLMTHPAERAYTDAGRSVLVALSLAGAIAYISTILAALRDRLPLLNLRAAPHPALLAIVFVLVTLFTSQAACLLLAIVAAPLSHLDATQSLSTGVLSFGWLPQRPAGALAWLIAVLGLLTAAGWTLWIMPFAAWRRRCLQSAAATGVTFGSWILFLILAAALLAAFESPRGGRESGAVPDSLAARHSGERLSRCALQVFSAAGAGVQTEALSERSASDGTKVVLAAVMLVGGFPGSPLGGLGWPLAAALLIGAFAGRTRDERAFAIAVRLAVTLLALVLLTALGLLVIEHFTATAYQPPPTFADAFLDASSAVAGGGLTSGVSAAVTSRNLSSGIQQRVDVYQYGMAWLMLAMLLGRIAPVWIIAASPVDQSRDPSEPRP
ncbi:Cation transport protein [Phycisphaerae bacterium RAS1]|nr:Cation transport protein [Phycisphaerae bacterium RAS1]